MLLDTEISMQNLKALVVIIQKVIHLIHSQQSPRSSLDVSPRGSIDFRKATNSNPEPSIREGKLHLTDLSIENLLKKSVQVLLNPIFEMLLLNLGLLNQHKTMISSIIHHRIHLLNGRIKTIHLGINNVCKINNNHKCQ